MKTARYGRLDVVLPGHDDDLRAVPDLGRRGNLADFEYVDATVRQLDVDDRRISRGRLRGVEAQRAIFTDASVESVSFVRCSLLSSRWERCSLSRVVFRDCRLIGMTVDEQKWTNVVFQGCVIEYAQVDHVRSTGPVVFVDCTLRDVTFTQCDFSRGYMSGCELRGVEFAGGSYADMDLRYVDGGRER